MNLQFRLGQIIRISTSFFKTTLKDDSRKTAPYKLVYYCGKSTVPYLNKSLISVYKSWSTLPEIVIVTDGTSISDISAKMLKWPRNTEIFTWKDAAQFFKEKGNDNLYNYASNEVYGRKFVGILFCAENNKILYSDTDVLWFKDPQIDFTLDKENYPTIKLGGDIEHCYDKNLIDLLKLEEMYSKTPLNSGIIYAKGDFSIYPKWIDFCDYLGNRPGKWHEQTAFAVLNNFFGSTWKKSEMFLQVEDINEILPRRYRKEYKSFIARHYVNTKPWLFWRDYMLYFFKH